MNDTRNVLGIVFCPTCKQDTMPLEQTGRCGFCNTRLIPKATLKARTARRKARPNALRGTALTEREVDVLVAAAHGLSAAETGVAMNLAAETVKTYRKHLLARLPARNMTQAVAIAYMRGLLK